ncbi:hypothetical protein PpBr36_08660 [Pyricularia pennisetigena]|uniref:hypothetical protein n=1 Tax=Pyricularia pennisetigena TaxID=1578925 RepID=UPI001151F9D5|nr:hypothetical protein PpBr36_08660 [Pyricularia pennisetigena]TLS24824.1 hypothetical protein PpBr36_08660 [Pyricularia pennisetigena]
MPSLARASPESSYRSTPSDGASYSTSTPSNSLTHLCPKPKAAGFLNRRARCEGKERQQQPTAEYMGRKSTSSSVMSTSTGSTMPHPPTTDSSKKRDSLSGLPPPLTKEEFEALPLAVQRKYFSTLERLRFAQSSGSVEGIFDHYVENVKRRRPRQERSASDHFVGKVRRRPLRQPQPQTFDADSLSFVNNLPEKIKKRQFTREEQVVLAKHLRASVILDAADEAVYKVGRRASKTFTSDVDTLTSSSLDSPLASPLSFDTITPSTIDPMDRHIPHSAGVSTPSSEASPSIPDSFYDSFRWMEDEDDLDLRLSMDYYHANLRDALPSSKHDRRPSFRRHLSITKLPFGRSSTSLSRPMTKDAASTPTSPIHSPKGFGNSSAPISSRRSRTMSLISSRQAQHDLSSPVDQAAAHYQDPEARLKLRVYLASPQKFDEAIEFGFPSVDARPVASEGLQDAPQKLKNRQSQQALTGSTKGLETFFAEDDEDDDDEKLSDSEQGSLGEPDSPKTPLATEKPQIRPTRLPPDSYTQIPVSSREMTLRMTLTRPDLRASEDQIYRWKQGQPQQANNRAQASQTAIYRDDFTTSVLLDAGPQDGMDRSLGGLDHWAPPADNNVMKRIWNRVRRS